MAIPASVRNANFRHLKEWADWQRKVRNCEIEGMIEDTEADFMTAYCLRFISMNQLDILLRRLYGAKPVRASG